MASSKLKILLLSASAGHLRRIVPNCEESGDVVVIKRSCLGQPAALWSSNAQVLVSFHESIKPVDTCHSLFPIPREVQAMILQPAQRLSAYMFQ
jgi:hypothetical protein